jgi:hypothetical protein
LLAEAHHASAICLQRTLGEKAAESLNLTRLRPHLPGVDEIGTASIDGIGDSFVTDLVVRLAGWNGN